jgi:hypothetical protein
MSGGRGNRFPDFDDREAFSRGARKPAAVPRDLAGVPLPAKLSNYQSSDNLPANATQTTPVYTPTVPGTNEYVPFLHGEAGLSWPRVVNIFSARQGAFDARIEWTGGGGTGGIVFVTGSGGGLQLFLRCKTVKVEIANWLNIAQRVTVAVEDGFGQTQELHRIERTLALGAGAFQDFAIPPYAREVRVQSDVPGQSALILIQQIDDGPTVMSAFPATEGFVPVGSASRLRVVNNNPGALVSYVVDFKLGYQ